MSPGMTTIAPPTPNNPETTPAAKPTSATNIQVIALSSLEEVRSPAPAARGLDAEHVAGLEARADLRRQRRPVQQRAARRAARPARHSRGHVAAPLREHAQLHQRQGLELPDYPLPTSPLPHTPAPPSQGVGPHPQRALHLEHLDRRIARVGHADVHAGRPVRPTAGALPTADRLVVRPASRPPPPPPPPPPRPPVHPAPPSRPPRVRRTRPARPPPPGPCRGPGARWRRRPRRRARAPPG